MDKYIQGESCEEVNKCEIDDTNDSQDRADNLADAISEMRYWATSQIVKIDIAEAEPMGASEGWRHGQ